MFSKKLLNLFLVTLLLFSSFLLVPTSLVEADGVDVTPPVVKSLTLSKNAAIPGDTIKIVVKASDSEAGFVPIDSMKYSYIFLKNTNSTDILIGGSSYSFTYNPTLDEFFVSIEIPMNTKNGKYYCEVYVRDRFGNTGHKSFFDVTLTITGGIEDITKPSIESFSLSKYNVKPGDNVSITLKASDTGSGIPNLEKPVGVYFANNEYPRSISKINGNNTHVMLEYYGNGVYKGNFIVSNLAYDGPYTPAVMITDKADNSLYKIFSDNILTVTGGQFPDLLPEIKTFNIVGKDFYPKDTVSFELETEEYEYDFSELMVMVNISCKSYPSFFNIDLGHTKILKYDSSFKKFVGKFMLPVNIPEGEYIAYATIEDKYHENLTYKNVSLTFNVKSPITYSKDPIPLNATFDPMKSVAAKSPYEGDMLEKIKYFGEIDTSKTGLNLYKYEVVGKDGDLYEDFRWVMVSDSYYSIVDGILCTNNNIDILVSDETDKEAVVTDFDGKILSKNDDITLKDSGIYNIKLLDNTPSLKSNKGIKQIETISLSNTFTQVDTSTVTTTSFGFGLDVDVDNDRMFGMSNTEVLMPLYLSSGTDIDSMTLRVLIDKEPARIWGVEDGARIRGSISPIAEETDCHATLNGKNYVLGTKISTPGKYLLNVIDRAGNISKVKFMILGANGEVVNSENYEGEGVSNGNDSVNSGSNSGETDESYNSNSTAYSAKNTTENSTPNIKRSSLISVTATYAIYIFVFLLIAAGIIVLVLYIKNKKAES